MDIRGALNVGDVVNIRDLGRVLVISLSGLGNKPIVVQTLESGHHIWTLYPNGRLNYTGYTSLDVMIKEDEV